MEFRTKYSFYRDAKIKFSHYENGRTAIIIFNGDDISDAPIMVATVNIPSEPLSDNEVIIKDWSENEGVTVWLQHNSIIGPVKREIPTGFMKAQVCDLLTDSSDDSY